VHGCALSTVDAGSAYVHAIGGLFLGKLQHKSIVQQIVDLSSMGGGGRVGWRPEALNRAKNSGLNAQHTILSVTTYCSAKRFRGLIVGIVQVGQSLVKFSFELLASDHCVVKQT
jgi:hypothetical protein